MRPRPEKKELDEALERLYGRGIASQERCQCETGIADLQNALSLHPVVRREFERMGFLALHPASSELEEGT